VIRRLALVVLLVTLAARHLRAQPVPVERVESLALTVSDLNASVEWYTRVLDARAEPARELAGDRVDRLFGQFGTRIRSVRLSIGDECIDLIEFIAPTGRAFPADTRSNDGWFQHAAIVVRDMDEAYARLRAEGVASASPEPQTLPEWNANAAGIRAFYFRDPDGHFLEVIQFPAGKGDPRWQRQSQALFLGIDHTAIVVDDTDEALRFYEGVLGLRAASGSENHGPEQERLNAVFPARLRITTLRAQGGGPGVELLEYLTPRDGRATPSDTRPADLWSWHIVMTTATDPAPLFRESRRSGGAPVSPGTFDADFPRADSDDSILVRDPDAHAVLVTRTP